MKKSFLYPIVFMALITLVFVAGLAGLNAATAETIWFNKEIELQQKVLYVFDKLPQGADSKAVEEAFKTHVVQKNMAEKRGYAFVENGEETAYAIPFDGAGLWGSITGYVGLNKDATKIIGVEFVTQSETPGLGGRIAEDFYKEQYRDIDISGATKGAYIITNPAPGGNIDAIAGATQTSSSVVKMLNEDLAAFFEKGGVN